MGSFIELNDTLQITSEQGFPAELDLQVHLTTPLVAADFEGKTFEFRDKKSIRVFQRPPVRVFLVQNIADKWVYWGLVHVLSVTHDYVTETTSGTFKIVYLNSPEEMKQAQNLIDGPNSDHGYF